MRLSTTNQWRGLERWSPRLFVLAAGCLLVGAANSGFAFASDGYAFNDWLGIVLEFGRLAALLGTVGVSVAVVRRRERLGRFTRAVATLAAVLIGVLIAMATLTAVGVLAEPVGIVGLVAYLLSVGAFLAVGLAVLATGAHAQVVGGLLLVNVAALLVVFFGRLVVPLELLAAVVPTIQAFLYSGVGYTLRGTSAVTQEPTPATETTP